MTAPAMHRLTNLSYTTIINITMIRPKLGDLVSGYVTVEDVNVPGH